MENLLGFISAKFGVPCQFTCSDQRICVSEDSGYI